jgi:hypothetical protein
MSPMRSGIVAKYVRGRVRDAVRRAAEQWCPECQKRVQPFHMCSTGTDFSQRKAAAAREAARRAKRRNAAGSQRPARQAHDYSTCTDARCPRRDCRIFREGQAACPLTHNA